jgi:isochorismate synthase EntC
MSFLPPLLRRYPNLARELEALAATARPTDLLSLSLPADDLPPPTYLAGPESLAWQRPDDTWLALGSAFTVESAGPGRFAALNAGWQGLAARWQQRDLCPADEGAVFPPGAFASRQPHSEPGPDHASNQAPGPLAHLGFAFYDRPDSADPLPNARLRVPALLLRRQGDVQRLILSTSAGAVAQALAEWQTLWASLGQMLAQGSAPADAPVGIHSPARSDVASDAPRWHRPPAPVTDRAFLARTRAALAAIAAGTVDKVVLSRRVRLLADHGQGEGQPGHGTPCPTRLFTALARQQPGCTVFAVGHGGGTFLGATPERLLTLRGGQLETEALAGTSWGADAPLGTDKNQREHGWVAAAIHRTLAPLCAELSMAPADVLQLPGSRGLSHLRTAFRGQAAEGVGLLDLAARLHPTPAVGGWPAQTAREWLQAHREARPCWYSGGLGWIDPAGNGTLAVPLRCANLQGREAELQAGAGIVAGSDPAQELAETEAKLAAMLDALHAAGEAAGPGVGTPSPTDAACHPAPRTSCGNAAP